eukprot:CAMPEP_0206615316 /NCGR_PEP_ID=MMETSP0325_2-20121206/58086_1 /ASSEMBLY_ACC=CAM_ASM_000347 /TAXON_ID=2866 /ORGANISM="Crypthecodinium cohnii, Strain Seligo" /LENGTH=64 /DNA_ID=CAMNT_0054136323 /DNA_START=96 /DNA_END=287 /DNA_ORIENTATION=+
MKPAAPPLPGAIARQIIEHLLVSLSPVDVWLCTNVYVHMVQGQHANIYIPTRMDHEGYGRSMCQ